MLKHKTLFWYVSKELIGPFALGLLIFTFILLMDQILKLMELIINKGIGLGEVGMLLFYLLPSLLVITIPMSILLAILIALGKLSADLEIIAMKASGISLHQMLPPYAGLCFIAFLLTYAMTLFLSPAGNRAFRTQVIDMARQHTEASLEEGVFNDAFEGLVIYINEFDRDAKKINGILISDKRDPETPILIVAEDALIVSGLQDNRLVFKLANGSLHRVERGSRAYHYALFATYEMDIRPGKTDEHYELKHKDLDFGSLLTLARDREQQQKSTRRINAEIQKRLAFPFGCLVFGILAVPLGVTLRRGGRSYGFVLSIVIVFCYYLVLNVGESMAKSGLLPVFVGIWLPNFVLGALGIYLYRQVAREKPVIFQKALEACRERAQLPMKLFLQRFLYRH